jgi:excisionase family DNA binding protein
MSTPIVQALLDELDDRALDELATRLAPRLRPAEPQQPATLLTTRQVAERVGVHERTIARAVSASRLEATKVGGRWRIAPAAVDAWLTTGHATDTPPRSRRRARSSGTTLKDALK